MKVILFYMEQVTSGADIMITQQAKYSTLSFGDPLYWTISPLQ